jgi:hypothetical protein
MIDTPVCVIVLQVADIPAIGNCTPKTQANPLSSW